VSSPRREDVTYNLQFTGDVLPILQASIFSRVSGNLEKIFVEMGDVVRQDQLLALIDTTELYQQYQQAAAAFQNARLSYDRARELFDRNLGSKQDQDNTEAVAKIAEANYALAATKLGYAKITAPFAGIITRRFLDPGALVSPGSTTLFTLMDLDRVKVIIHVLEKDIPRVTHGKPALVTVGAVPGQKFTGEITRYSEAVDPDTRTMAVEIDISNADHRLKPGMFANVNLIVDRHENALTIATPAILQDDLGNFGYVVRADTAWKARITPGAELDTRTEILSGISDTTAQVITAGQQFAKDGGPVTIQP